MLIPTREKVTDIHQLVFPKGTINQHF